jgi:hypothetical protein
VQEVLGDRTGPFIAATDYMKTVADQIGNGAGLGVVLGTDGFKRSDCAPSCAILEGTGTTLRSQPRRWPTSGWMRTGVCHADLGIDPENPTP